MSKTDSYLNYIDKLYQRKSNEQKSVGYSLWVIYVAVVYVMWETIELLVLDTKQLSQTAVLYFHTYWAVVLIIASFPHFDRLSKFNRYDYRVSTANSNSGKNAIICLITLIPAIIPAVFISGESRSHEWVVNITLWVILLTAGISILWGIYERSYRHNTGYAPISSLNSPEIPRFFKYLDLLVFCLGIAHAYFLYASIKLVWGSSGQVKILLLAVNLCLLNYLLRLLVITLFRDSGLKAVQRLERDIVMHSIDESEIKRRIEEEIIGDVEFHSWVSEKQSSLDLQKEEIIGTINESENLFAEIQSISSQYKDERLARVNRYSKKLHTELEKYHDSVKKMSNWLKGSKEHLRYTKNDYLKGIIDEKITSLEVAVNEVSSKTRAAISKLKGLDEM